MQKVIIVGPCGSGKSTLAGKLHTLTGLPLYYPDNIFWKQDRTHMHNGRRRTLNDYIQRNRFNVFREN